MPSDEGAVLDKGGQLEAANPNTITGSSSGYTETAMWALNLLRPSWLTRGASRPQRLRRTAWVDGMRGFAALLVYILHHELWAHEPHRAEQIMQSSYGYEGRHYFITLPWIRTFFTGGHGAVAIFFILSGYVLATKPIALLYSGDHSSLIGNIGSAIFRRWFRLYLPIFFVTLNCVSLWHWSGVETSFPPKGSFSDEIFSWYQEMVIYTFFYGSTQPPWFSTHPHTWTLPVEFKGSMFVYINIIALSKATRRARLACWGVVVWYCVYITDGSWYAMFITGVILADIDLHDTEEYFPDWMLRLRGYSNYIYHGMLIVGVYLLGCPSWVRDDWYFAKNPGWRWAYPFKPYAVFDTKWYFLYYAALFIVISVPRIPWAKRFFELRFNQYLGRVSYMLYLLHGPILWTIGDRVYAATGWERITHATVIPKWINLMPLPRWGPFGLELGFLLPHLFMLPLTLWAADLGTTFVDTPSIKFGNWLYKRTLPASEAEK